MRGAVAGRLPRFFVSGAILMTRKIIKLGLFISGIAIAATGMVLFLLSFVPPMVFREPFLRSIICVAGMFLICAA